MISAMGQEAMVREALINGAKSFIVKPFKDRQVIKVLNQVLRNVAIGGKLCQVHILMNLCLICSYLKQVN